MEANQKTNSERLRWIYLESDQKRQTLERKTTRRRDGVDVELGRRRLHPGQLVRVELAEQRRHKCQLHFNIIHRPSVTLLKNNVHFLKHTLDAQSKNETPRTDDVCLLWAKPIFLPFI